MNFTDYDLKHLGYFHREHYSLKPPFPNIYFDGVFDDVALGSVLQEILAMDRNLFSYGSHSTDAKGGCSDINSYSDVTKEFFYWLMSKPFLEFLQVLTGMEETLIPDPYLFGGGIHEVRPGGFLKIHADFNKHPLMKLDRRLNVLIYMNKNWNPEYGGDFELWDKDISKSVVKISPVFNRMAIFNTTSTSWHGHPDPLTCPRYRTRIGINMYYYTNGRPATEERFRHSTLFQARKGNWNDKKAMTKNFIKQFVPPIIYRFIK